MLQLDEAQFGIATGQAAAFYEFTNPNHLLGELDFACAVDSR